MRLYCLELYKTKSMCSSLFACSFDPVWFKLPTKPRGHAVGTVPNLAKVSGPFVTSQIADFQGFLAIGSNKRCTGLTSPILGE